MRRKKSQEKKPGMWTVILYLVKFSPISIRRVCKIMDYGQIQMTNKARKEKESKKKPGQWLRSK